MWCKMSNILKLGEGYYIVFISVKKNLIKDVGFNGWKIEIVYF